MRAEFPRADCHAAAGEFILKMAVNDTDLTFGEIASSHTRLIGDNDQDKTGTLEQPQAVYHAWQQAHLFDLAEIMGFLDEGTVPVEENRRAE